MFGKERKSPGIFRRDGEKQVSALPEQFLATFIFGSSQEVKKLLADFWTRERFQGTLLGHDAYELLRDLRDIYGGESTESGR